MKSSLFYIIIFLICFSAEGTAQTVKLHIELKDSIPEAVEIQNKLEGSYKDSLELKSRLKETIRDLRRNGYMAASFDSLRINEESAFVSFYPGEQFRWGKFDVANLPDGVDVSKYSENFKRQTIIKLPDFLTMQDYIISKLQNRGFPFPELQFRNISFPENDTVHASLYVHPGEKYTIDTIYIKGEAPVDRKYIFPKLGIFPGMTYDASVLSRISSTVERISFITEVKPAEIDFSDEQRANLYLYLDKAKSNRLSGVVGFLSDDQQPFRLTGNVDLSLQNAFKRGEEVQVQWESFEEQSQKLDMKFYYPYLLFQNIGIDMEGSLFKQDTTYLTTNARLGFPFQIASNKSLEIFGKFQRSSVISETDESLDGYSDYRDYRKTLYGMGYMHNTLDYDLNPTHGTYLNVRSSLGNKKNEELRAVHLESELEISYFQPLINAFVLKSSLNGGYMKSWVDSASGEFSKNELFRFGGNTLLRGFQENHFYASLYSVASVELRYLLGRNSNIHLFWDGAYYKNSLSEQAGEDFPFGFGVGASLDTGGGIISLSYALGKESGHPVEIKNAKLHIGYINKF
ncbi:MAG: BamA/TamA family outer membrane protein [Bacteroidota bacterium]